MFKKVMYKALGRNPWRESDPDDFILRLRSSVIGEGMLHSGNIYLMEKAVREMPVGGCLLEIGSYGGLSANLLTYFLQKYNRSEQLFCCDAWLYEGYHDAESGPTPWMDGRKDVLRTDFMNHIKNSFISSCRLLSAQTLPKAIHMDSDSFFESWAATNFETDVFGRQITLGGAISFAYIDGNHAYEYAKRDFENTDKYLLPGGFVLLDDSARHLSFGSVKLANELCKQPQYELVLENPNFLFRKKPA
ncbi:MAG: class I SAM-dependent methyltransferase [Saprospiraceae bacterium]